MHMTFKNRLYIHRVLVLQSQAISVQLEKPVLNYVFVIFATLPLPMGMGGGADPQRFFFDNFKKKQVRNMKLCVIQL